MKNKENFNKWLIVLAIISSFKIVKSQLESMSNVGNIVLEQDPRDQDPFYRKFYARAEGMPLAAVNSVVHNVKHQSEGQFKLWHELPSHRVRPGYTTTTKAPKIKTTTIPWVRGRHRPQLGQQHAPWYQKFSDPGGDDNGADYDEEPLPAPRPRGRRPPAPGGRGRRPPAPNAPVRVQVGKGEELVENGDGGAFAGAEEGTKADSGDSEGTMKTEGVKMTTGKPSNVDVKTTKKPEKKKGNKEENEKKVDDEETKKGEEISEDEGGKHGEIDLAELKKGGVVHNLRTSGKGKTVGDKEDNKEEEEDDDDVEKEETDEDDKKKKKKKGKKEEDDEEDKDEEEEKDKKKSKKQKEKRKKEKKNEEKRDKKSKKKGGKKNKTEDEDEEDNGKLNKVDGDVKIQKAVDGDTDAHDEKEVDDDDDDDEENDEESYDKEENHSRKKYGKKGKKKAKARKSYDEEEEEDYNEEDDDEHENEEAAKHQKKKEKNGKISCPPSQKYQNPHQPHHGNQNIPSNQVPYPHPNTYEYTHSTGPTTATTTIASEYSGGRVGDDYHDFEIMDCIEKKENEDDEESEEGDEHSVKKKMQKKKKKSKNNNKKKGKKKSRKNKGGKKNHISLDYLTSREKIDQNKRNRGHILDELHADEDLKKIRKTSKSSDFGVDCSTAADEFPLKCGAWKSAGFCDTNQATQFLWCRKTCLCSKTTNTSTMSTSNIE